MSKFNGLGISLGKGSFIGFAIEKVVVPGLPDDQRKKGRISDHRIRTMNGISQSQIFRDPSVKPKSDVMAIFDTPGASFTASLPAFEKASPEMSNVFLNNDGIVPSPSISKETRLARADESMHVRFQPISNDLGDNFLLNVADPNGSEVPQVDSFIAFGDEA
ncbi:hypothetical protein FXO38_16903 [Capsicum annuum]|nr:hypothetical protein FXO38_16903 [Capsicum annuum]KAF3663661.1 hypothetical protein FXO37_11848 [Capsicum annuum]